MKEEKNIPFKNYIFLAIVLLLSIFIVIYFYMWYGEIEDNRVNTPILDDYLGVINYNELDDYLIENNDVYVYVSVLNDEKTRKFEKKFKNYVNKYNLNNNILYLDLTDESRNKKLFYNIKNKYNIVNLPCIISFKNGILYDIYNIPEYNYDLELIISYFRIRGVIND